MSFKIGVSQGAAGALLGAPEVLVGTRSWAPAQTCQLRASPRETRAGVQVCAEPAPSQAGGEGPCRGGRLGRAPPEVRTLDLPARRSQGEGRPLCSSFHCPWGQKNVRPDLGARGLSQNQHPRRAVLEECPARGHPQLHRKPGLPGESPEGVAWSLPRRASGLEAAPGLEGGSLKCGGLQAPQTSWAAPEFQVSQFTVARGLPLLRDEASSRALFSVTVGDRGLS